MKNKPSLTRRILYNDNLLKILSIIIAVLFWFIVVINVNTETNRTIYSVNVKIDENSAALTQLGLHVVDMSQKTISVQVSGARNLIGALNSDDFVVTPNISKVSKSGNYEINLSAALKTPDNRIKILKINPSAINVNFDTMVTKTLPVKIKISGGNVPEGYLMQKSTSLPETITVSGPTAELNKVAAAQVEISVPNGSTKTISDKCNVKIYDKSGNEIKSDHILLSNSTVQITVPILKTKTVPLKVNFMNVPSDVDAKIISYTVSPAQITVAGDESTINALTQIQVATIDFSDLNVETDKDVEIKVPDGVVNIENVVNAKVSVKINNTSTKTVDASDFTITGAQAGMKVENLTKKISNIQLFGPTNDIGSISSISAYINVSSINGTGQHEVPVTFKVPGKTGFWVKGDYNAIVNVKN